MGLAVKLMTDRSLKRAALGALLVFLCGLLVTAAYVENRHEAAENLSQARFVSLVNKTTQQLRERLLSYEHGLRGTRSALLAYGSRQMPLARFRMISSSRDPEREFPGVRGFGFIERVAVDKEAEFLADAARGGRENLRIRMLRPHDEERFVIKFIEPEAPNREAVGLDIGSEANRRQAIIESFSSGKATLTHPITLVQAEGKVRQGFLLFVPIYENHDVPATAAARAKAAIGAAYAPLLIDEVLNGLLVEADGIALLLSDVGANGVKDVFYTVGGEALEGSLAASRTIDIFGRQWRADYRALPRFDTLMPRSSPAVSFLIGALLSLLLAVAVFREIRSRQQLNESEERLKRFVAQAPAALAMFDREMRYLAVSQRWASDYQLNAGQLPGRRHYDVVPNVSLAWRDTHRRALAGEVLRAEREAFTRGDGSLIWLRWEVRPWVNRDNEIGGIVIFSEDVSSMKQAEDEIRRLNASLEIQVAERTRELDDARRTLRTVLDAVPSMIGYWDRNLCNRVANHAVADWFAVDPASLDGMPLNTLFGEALFERTQGHLRSVLGGRPQTFELDIPRPDGQGVRHALAHYLPDVLGGEVVGFHAIVHDVTELMESRQRLAEILRENELLLHSIDRQLIYSVTDAAGMIVHVNDKFCQICEYSREELIGQDHRLIASGLHGADFWSRMWSEILAGRAWRGDICNRSKSGQLFWVDTVIAPQFDRHGKLEKIVSLRYDVTVSRHALQALEEAKREAERANLAKSAFLANTSHEIRTPLNAVIGMAYLLAQMPLTKEQRQYVEAILTAGRSLLDLINDVLDLAKIEAGEMIYEWRVFPLQALLDEVAAIFQSQALDKGLTLRLAPVPASVPPVVIGDALRLRQVFGNLIGNAIKFTERGSVDVRIGGVESAHGDSGMFWLHGEVEDSGIGISSDGIAQLFTPFAQLDSSITRRYGGTGLGLSIVRQLVEGMGGKVGVESKPGQGSLFWFELPLGIGQHELVQVSKQIQVRSLDLLVAAAEPELCEILTGMSAQLGWRVSVVDSGAQLIDTVQRRRQDGQPFDCVVVDEKLSDMAGEQAIRQLKAVLADERVPVVLTKATAEAAGVTPNVLVKPVNPSTLFNSVNEALVSCGRGYSHVLTATSLNDGHSHWLPGIRVLVVDDSALNLDVCRRLLERQGAEVEVCCNGAEAVDLLRGASSRFDAVLMDVQMPVMDGLAATRAIRDELGLKQLPILALTAGVLHTQIEQALQAGMNEVLTKPLEPELLIRTVRMQIEAYRGGSLPVERLPELPAMNPPQGGVEDFPEIVGIDRQQSHQRLMGDVDFLRLLLQRFVDEYAEMPREIQAMVRFGQPAAAAAQLHKVRGVAGNFGAAKFAAAALALEKCLLNGGGDNEALLDEFQLIHRELIDGISGWLASLPTPAVKSADGVEYDPAQLNQCLEQLALMLADNLLSANVLCSEIEMLLINSSRRDEFRTVAREVRNLRYAAAREALDAFRLDGDSSREDA